ncbi:MAG: hypothetical protein Q8M99_08040 [Methylotenera sp.]|nr:hypothetical protein [Methylotenera sp.]
METIQSANRHFEEFLLGPHSHGFRGDSLIRIHISRNTLIAIIFSILVHVLIVFIALPQIQFDNTSAPLPRSLEVSLAPPIPPKVIETAPLEIPLEKPVPKAVKSKPKVMTQKSSKNTKPSTFSVPDVISTKQPSPEVLPPKESKPVDVPTDMASYVKAQQAKRNAMEADAAKQNSEAVARELGPSAEQVRDERIKNNFKNGTNGIFEITSLSSRHAGFSFRGWTDDYSNSKRESFEVEAATGQDVRLVMIRKMISLIRRHYQGDFNWESQRLGRTIVLSARHEDSAGLEDFMMTEFFGSNYKRL